MLWECDENRVPDHDGIYEPKGVPDDPKYAFSSEEELVQSKFFQDALLKSLAHKDREIRELQQELLERGASHEQCARSV